MKYGIDNLIKIIEDYGNAVGKFHKDSKEINGLFRDGEAEIRIATLKKKMESTALKHEEYFNKQLPETIEAIEKDQSASKYMSDAGFTTTIQVLSSGGEQLNTGVLKSLVAPYMDDYIAKKSVVAILKQQGRNPKNLGIDDGADALAILKGIQRECYMTFRQWGVNGGFSPLSAPSVIHHQLERANQILEGGFDPLLEVETF